MIFSLKSQQPLPAEIVIKPCLLTVATEVLITVALKRCQRDQQHRYCHDNAHPEVIAPGNGHILRQNMQTHNKVARLPIGVISTKSPPMTLA